MSAAAVPDRLMKLREARIAKEKDRIDKLRELNLKKYNSNEPQGILKSISNTHIKSNNTNSKLIGTKRPITAPVPKKENDVMINSSKITHVENKLDAKKNNYIKKNIDAFKNAQSSKSFDKNIDTFKKAQSSKSFEKNIEAFKNAQSSKSFDKNIDAFKNAQSSKSFDKNIDAFKNAQSSKSFESSKMNKAPVAITENKIATKITEKSTINNKINNDKLFDRKPKPSNSKTEVLAEIKPFKKIDPKLSRKSIAVFQKPASNLPVASRKSMLPKIDVSKESVFERLYKPKYAAKKPTDEVKKLQTDPKYLKKVIKSSSLIVRHTCFEPKEVKAPALPVRRSISAVHFKRISKNEIGNCIYKWASIGDKLNTQHLTIDEGESINEDKVVSAVKSERKKVTFMTPMSRLNTPRPEELQSRLKAWLLKRGKSLDSYQHLQCFGLHHVTKPLQLDSTLSNNIDRYSEENKENIAVDSDSDDGSYADNMIAQKGAVSQGDSIDIDKWRQTSAANESVYTEFNDSADFNETTVTSADTYANVYDMLTGALNDLADLLREGFEWEQAARYLRAIRTRFSSAPSTAAYWECRAALEERRGDLHASVQCWEEAIAKGTQRDVVESSLDTLLNKFMQLKISPHSAGSKRPDPKMLDVKNVFMSTIIRFAVQQAKLRQSETPVVTVTPVRRSGRLSHCPTPRDTTPCLSTARGNTPRAPLRLCDTVKEVKTLAPEFVFTPNKNLAQTP